MKALPLRDQEIALLLVKHGEEFTCCKRLVGVSYLDCGAETEKRISSSAAAMRRQVNSGDFRVKVSFYPSGHEDGQGEWLVSLVARFGARSPQGTPRTDMAYEVIAPVPAQLLALHEASQIARASKPSNSSPRRAVKNRIDTL
ncbi:hypothetical protein NM04_14825 [Massilia aurea]|uniref:Uncharacterized protein n=1 Tax=Massilia aurea TaxID=373040 RepID=A0A422QJ85_9BURK|nr:hypothetical protein [Massilia aurea]RNF30016.1 hypothetical protein NM04_14825 [Massilia aurea]